MPPTRTCYCVTEQPKRRRTVLSLKDKNFSEQRLSLARVSGQSGFGLLCATGASGGKREVTRASRRSQPCHGRKQLLSTTQVDSETQSRWCKVGGS